MLRAATSISFLPPPSPSRPNEGPSTPLPHSGVFFMRQRRKKRDLPLLPASPGSAAASFASRARVYFWAPWFAAGPSDGRPLSFSSAVLE